MSFPFLLHHNKYLPYSQTNLNIVRSTQFPYLVLKYQTYSQMILQNNSDKVEGDCCVPYLTQMLVFSVWLCVELQLVSPIGCRKGANVALIIFQGEFVGLILLITKFLDKTGIDAAARVKIDKILKFISKKASGKSVSCDLIVLIRVIVTQLIQ